MSSLFFAEEFVAHGSNVNCLALGHKSGHVMVTGGEDKKVNMWTVGKPNCIMVGNFFILLKSGNRYLDIERGGGSYMPRTILVLG